MASVEQRAIKWDSAQVEDAVLTLELTGANSKGWKARFENVLALLDTPHSSWGDVRLNKSRVTVAAVLPGSESELHHFLESIVLQANADGEPDAREQQAANDHGQDEPDADEQMTQAFKAFSGDRS